MHVETKRPKKSAARIDIAKRIRSARIEAGLTRNKLAAALDCDQTLIYYYETAASAPSIDKLYAIADACDLSLAELFGFDVSDIELATPARSAA